MRDDLGVGFGDKLVALRGQLAFQFKIIFDDAVVNHHDAAGAIAVRVRVLFGGAAVSGPARVAESVDSIEWIQADGFLEIAQLARGAADIHGAIGLHDGNPSGIVAAVFEAAKSIQD